jgi:hypothetical protein
MSVTQAEIRKLALSFAGAVDASTPKGLVFAVGGRGFVWTYYGRVEAKKPRVAFPDVVAVSCTLESKDMLIEAAPETYFTDDHYKGYPAVLVRLKKASKREFAALLKNAWSLKAGEKPRRPRPKRKQTRARQRAPKQKAGEQKAKV